MGRMKTEEIDKAINALKNGNAKQRELAIAKVERYRKGERTTIDLSSLVGTSSLPAVVSYLESQGTSYSKESLITFINALFGAVEDTAKVIAEDTGNDRMMQMVEAYLKIHMHLLMSD